MALHKLPSDQMSLQGTSGGNVAVSRLTTIASAPVLTATTAGGRTATLAAHKQVGGGSGLTKVITVNPLLRPSPQKIQAKPIVINAPYVIPHATTVSKVQTQVDIAKKGTKVFKLTPEQFAAIKAGLYTEKHATLP